LIGQKNNINLFGRLSFYRGTLSPVFVYRPKIFSKLQNQTKNTGCVFRFSQPNKNAPDLVCFYSEYMPHALSSQVLLIYILLKVTEQRNDTKGPQIWNFATDIFHVMTRVRWQRVGIKTRG